MLKGVTSGGGGGITPGTTVITGGTNTRVLFDDNGVVGESAGFVYVKATGQATATLLVASTSLTAPLLQAGATGGTIALSTTAGQGPTIAAGTATTDVAALSLTRTNNNAAVATGVKWTFTDTTSAAGFLPFNILGTSTGAVSLFNIDKAGNAAFGGSVAQSGNITIPRASFYKWAAGNFSLYSDSNALSGAVQIADTSNGNSYATFASDGIYIAGSSGGLGWGSTATANSTRDAQLSRGGANQVVFAGNTVGGGTATSRAEINKSVTAIADNVATATFTVTIPNGANSGSIKVILTGSMGAGNLGANESTQAVEYDIDITRISGANAVAAIGAAIGLPGAATTAGGDAVAVTAALSAIAGAVGATNTFTVNVTIAKVGIHSQTNHTCLCYALLMNANASGITIA